MLTKNIQNLPNDWFKYLLLHCSDEVTKKAIFLFLTNKRFYTLYKKINEPWFEKFSNHFPYFPNAGKYRVQFWEKKYKITSSEEAVNEKAMKRYEKRSNNEKIEDIFDKIELNILSTTTAKTFFNYLVHYAASKNDQPLLDYLFHRLSVECYGKGKLRQVNFDHAILCNQVQILEEIINVDENDIQELESRGNFTLILENYSITGMLRKNLRHHESPEFVGSSLHLACSLGYTEIVELLAPLKESYSFNSKRQTEFCLAAKGGHTTLFPLLTKFKTALLKKKFGQPLYLAIENEDKKTFNELMNMGFKADWSGFSQGKTPLHLAAVTKDTYFLEQLLTQQGINLNVRKYNDNQSPLDAAIECGNEEAIKILKKAQLHNAPPEEQETNYCIDFNYLFGLIISTLIDWGYSLYAFIAGIFEYGESQESEDYSESFSF